MRIVFFGSGEVAGPTLEALRESHHEIAAVVTQPPRKAGRGAKVRPTPVDELAGRLAVPVVRTANINEPLQVSSLRGLGSDIIVVVDFGQRIGREVRDTPPHGAVNLHGSLLPKYRGAAPINWAIIRGEAQTGVTTFQVEDVIDSGPILMQQSLDIGPEETAGQLRMRLARLGADVMLRTLDGLAGGTVQPRPQDEAGVTFAPKLTKADGALDFTRGAQELVNHIRGIWPWPGAQADFVHAGHSPVRVIFSLARAETQTQTQTQTRAEQAAPGSIDEELRINVGDGVLQVMELKVAGKRLMTWKDFVNGYRVTTCDRFVTPAGRP